MNSLNPELIRHFAKDSVPARLADIKVFAEIDSTNTYLMQMPGPEPGSISIAATSNQTAGRGRHGKSWVSPPGSGLCLSAAYTFGKRPENLPALTLALGLGAVDALEELGAGGVELKWPNDLVALDGKLGGILTEVHGQSKNGVTVVTGIGINIDLPDEAGREFASDWTRQVVDLKLTCDKLPERAEIAGKVSGHLSNAFVEFEKHGFAKIADRWSQYDWLRGRELTIDTAAEEISGVGAGVAEDGALLIDTKDAGMRRATSGTIIFAGNRGEQQ